LKMDLLVQKGACLPACLHDNINKW
jgi:hypothetical protein